MSFKDKTDCLTSLFKENEKILVAFSGGVDSTYLLYALHKYSLANVGAITLKTAYIPQWEADEAVSLCKSLGIKHSVISLPVPDQLKHNPEDRCYICKKILFSKILEYAEEHNYSIVADGSNFDDTKDYRPGMRALEELEIRSPLKECRFTKKEIREGLKDAGLEIWNKPAYACLLTRFPHGSELDVNILATVEECELFIHKMGFPGTRLRIHRDIARIETDLQYHSEIIKPHKREKIIAKLKSAGIKYISLDLEGYRTGSMNPDNTDK